MSSAANLLDINVDELFETYGVSEIDAIHKKLQTDVEHKKEELRTMVGERYRDLLQAADTIGEMRHTSATTIEHICAITATCRRLNEQQLIGFRTAGTPTLSASVRAAAPPASAAERSLRQFHGLGVQIKLLATLPELIWSHCDGGDYFVATQLFALSRHISTGLQLDVHRPQMRLFPVAKHLWATLAPFYHTIRQRCLAALQRRDLDAEVAARCLASIVLLENCTADKLVATLIQLRGKAFRATLADEAEEADGQEQKEQANGGGGGGGRRIRDRVLASLRVLQSTVHLLHECFVAGAVRRLIDGLRDEAASEPTLALVLAAGGWAADGGVAAAKVPDIVAGFRPRCQLSDLQPDSLRSLCANWLQTTATDCRRQIQSVINGIASVSTIQTIRQQSVALAKPTANWPAILASLHLPADLDLYTYYYEPLIQERIQQIIAGCWAEIIQNARRDVELLVQHENHTDLEAKTSAKWTPNAADIPLSLQQALSPDKHRHLLALKARGYTPPSVAICSALDQQLATVCDELSSYLGAAEQGDAIRSYLQEASRQAVADLIEAIGQIPGHRSRSACVALATVFRGLAELCPNLKRCLHRQAAGTEQPQQASAASEWSHVCSLLDDESFRLWSQWMDLFVAEHTAQFPVASSLDYGHLAADMLGWERHTVQEKDENDAPVESAIRVPAHLSVGLQQFWHGVCVQLEATLVAYALPRRVTVALGDRLTGHLLAVYEGRAKSEVVAGNQTLALQAYFDVRFVQLVFVGRQSGGGRGGQTAEQWSLVAGAFKAAVDPFDFELFHRYLVANVKRSVQRMQHKLGVLIANPDQLASILSAAAAPAGVQDKEPNVLALSVERNEAAGYFALLPVINAPVKTHIAPAEPTKTKAKRAKTQATSAAAETTAGSGTGAADEGRQTTRSSAGGQQEQQQQQPANLANVKSGAAAFFGAMSKDWFQ